MNTPILFSMNESLVKPFIPIPMNTLLFSMKTAHALPHSFLFHSICVGVRMSFVVTLKAGVCLLVLGINWLDLRVKCIFIIVDRYRCTRGLIQTLHDVSYIPAHDKCLRLQEFFPIWIAVCFTINNCKFLIRQLHDFPVFDLRRVT